MTLTTLPLIAASATVFLTLGSAPASRQTTHEVTKVLQSLKHAGWDAKSPAVVVDIRRQRLLLYKNGGIEHAWKISSSKYGVGDAPQSYKTPLGLHRIWKKSGAEARIGQPLKHGEPTDAPVPEAGQSARVYITTRALMLDGLEDGNRTSKSRGIWIHGTSAEANIGRPASIGCVRMRAVDVARLFDEVPEQTLVYITDKNL